MGRKNFIGKLRQKIPKISEENIDLKILLFLIAFLAFTNSVLLYFYFQPRGFPEFKRWRKTQEIFTGPFSTSTTFPTFPTLNINSLFSSDHSWTATLSAEKKITMITTGDVIPARSVNFQMIKRNDFAWAFAKTYEYLKSADLTLINLEAPLTKNCPVTNTGMVFCGNQRFIKGLNLAGIDVANLANNHSLNYKLEGLCQTIELLGNNQILTSGFPEDNCPKNTPEALTPEVSVDFTSGVTPTSGVVSSINQLAIKKIKNTTFGFLGYDFLTSINQSEILQSIKVAKEKVDILVISTHWGAEYTHNPSSFQKELARQMIDEGADIIIGNHPHWIQPLEIYKGRPIIYAHGNFIFDQEWNQKTKLGITAKFIFFDKQIIDIEFKPLKIQFYGQPYWLEGEEKEKVLKLLEEISRDFAV